MTTYILIANKAESLSGGYVSARELVERRLTANVWPLFQNTPHQNEVHLGDTLLVYLAGQRERRFVATATALRVESARDYKADGPRALTNAPFKQLRVSDVKWFEVPVPIAEVKDRLEFIPKGTPKWGCVLQRGMKKISKRDASLILEEAAA
jgi:hypothetical protein